MPYHHLPTLHSPRPTRRELGHGLGCTRELPQVPRGLYSPAGVYHRSPCRPPSLSIPGCAFVSFQPLLLIKPFLTLFRIISQTLLVMGATMCPSLSALLPPPATMDDIINNVIHEMERLAHLAPSLRLSAELIQEAESKRQMWLRTAGLKFEN